MPASHPTERLDGLPQQNKRILKLFFRTLGAVFRAAFVAFLYTGRVKRAAYNGVTHPWKVFYTTTAHEHDGVLLQVVAFARDIGIHFFGVR